MNRKGNYPVALIIAVFISCIWLAVSVSDVYASIGDRVGLVQSPVLSLAGDMRLAESQLELAAGFSVDAALSELPKSPQAGRGCDFGSVYVASSEGRLFCPVLNDPEILSDFCHPEILSSFNDVFNSRLDSFIIDYNSGQDGWSFPLSSFDIMPFDDYSSVVGLEPVFITMRDPSGIVVGNASFRPAFTLDRSFLLDYPSMIEDSRDVIAACSSAVDPVSCATDLLPFVDARMVDDRLALVFPSDPVPLCFALNLPSAGLTT